MTLYDSTPSQCIFTIICCIYTRITRERPPDIPLKTLPPGAEITKHHKESDKRRTSPRLINAALANGSTGRLPSLVSHSALFFLNSAAARMGTSSPSAVRRSLSTS